MWTYRQTDTTKLASHNFTNTSKKVKPKSGQQEFEYSPSKALGYARLLGINYCYLRITKEVYLKAMT
jgi:hypothetical protein